MADYSTARFREYFASSVRDGVTAILPASLPIRKRPSNVVFLQFFCRSGTGIG